MLSGCRQQVVRSGAPAGSRAALFDFTQPRMAQNGYGQFPNGPGGGYANPNGQIVSRTQNLGTGVGWGNSWRDSWRNGVGGTSGSYSPQIAARPKTPTLRERLAGWWGGRSQPRSGQPANYGGGQYGSQPYGAGGVGYPRQNVAAAPDIRITPPASQTAQSYQPPIQVADPRLNQQYSQLASEVQDMNKRLSTYDTDNQLLHTEVAALKQKLQVANDYNYQLKQQLSDTANRFQSIQAEKATTEQQLAATQIQMQQINQTAEAQRQRFAQQQQQLQSGQTNGQLANYRNQNNGRTPAQLAGATLRANNSLMERFNQIRIPGGQARMDGDVIRIEFPSDQLFVPGSYEIQPTQTPMMQNLAQVIRQNFPRQIVGVEAHWDGTPLRPSGTTDHQLTATQALSVFNYLTRLGIPPNQMFNMAMGSNRPRHSRNSGNSINANRRIEVVIYPESYDGS